MFPQNSFNNKIQDAGYEKAELKENDEVEMLRQINFNLQQDLRKKDEEIQRMATMIYVFKKTCSLNSDWKRNMESWKIIRKKYKKWLNLPSNQKT